MSQNGVSGYVEIQVPRWMLQAGVSPRAALFAGLLFSKNWRHGKNPIVRRTGDGQAVIQRPLAWFAKVLGVSSTRTVRRLIAELEAHKLLHRYRTRESTPPGVYGKQKLFLFLHIGRWYKLMKLDDKSDLADEVVRLTNSEADIDDRLNTSFAKNVRHNHPPTGGSDINSNPLTGPSAPRGESLNDPDEVRSEDLLINQPVPGSTEP